MGAEHIRDADRLDQWWDAWQCGEIRDGIPTDDMHLIQEITTMYAQATSSAAEQRVWQLVISQIETARTGWRAAGRRSQRAPNVSGFSRPTRKTLRVKWQIAAILAVAICASLIVHRVEETDHAPVINAPDGRQTAERLSSDESVPAYRGDSARTGVMPGSGPEAAPGVIWQAQVHGSITHQPLLVDGTIFIDDSGGWIHAFDAVTGEVKWQISTGVGGESALVAGNGMIYATTYNGTLLALDAETGQEQWRDDRARPRFPPIVIDDKVVFDGVIDPENAEDGAVYTLDAATGEEIDQFAIAEAFRNLPAIRDGVIYGVVLRGDAYAYDLASHEQLWRVAVGSQSIDPITVEDDIAFVPLGTSNDNGQVVALDAATGEEIWRWGTADNSPVGAAIVTLEGRHYIYYACSANGTLYSNYAREGVGVYYEPYFEDEEVVAAPVYADDMVFIAGRKGTVVGTRGFYSSRWKVTLPGSIEAGPIVAGGLLWVGTTDGWLYALGAGGALLPETMGSSLTPSPESLAANAAESEWASSGDAVTLADPLDVAVDSAGNAYVVDAANEQVTVIGPDGKYVAEIGAFGSDPGYFHFRDYDAGVYGGIDVAPDDTIYVADPFNHRIQVFDRDYQFVREWGSAGAGEGQFNRPTGVVVANDRVYVADFGNNRVQIFTLDGEFVAQFGNFGSAEGQFNGPAGLAADRDGDVYVVDALGGRVQRYSPDGLFIQVIVDRGQIGEAWNIGIDSQGHVIVADGGRGQLRVFDREGNLLAVYDRYDAGAAGMIPVGLAILPDDSIYVTDWEGQQRLLKIRFPDVSGNQ